MDSLKGDFDLVRTNFVFHHTYYGEQTRALDEEMFKAIHSFLPPDGLYYATEPHLMDNESYSKYTNNQDTADRYLERGCFAPDITQTMR